MNRLKPKNHHHPSSWTAKV